MRDILEFRDLYLSAYLLARGFEATVRTERDTALFVFPATPSIKKAVEEFQANADIPILDFLNFFDRVKNFALDHRHGRMAIWRG